jgi:aspartate aminotransferase
VPFVYKWQAKDAGLSLATYRYYDKKTIGLDFSGMMEDIKKVG